MERKIYSPEKGKFVSVKTKHGQKVLKNYNEHRLGGDKHQNCAYCKIVNPKTGKMVSTYGQTGGRVIRSYNMIGGGKNNSNRRALIAEAAEKRLRESQEVAESERKKKENKKKNLKKILKYNTTLTNETLKLLLNKFNKLSNEDTKLYVGQSLNDVEKRIDNIIPIFNIAFSNKELYKYLLELYKKKLENRIKEYQNRIKDYNKSRYKKFLEIRLKYNKTVNNATKNLLLNILNELNTEKDIKSYLEQSSNDIKNRMKNIYIKNYEEDKKYTLKEIRAKPPRVLIFKIEYLTHLTDEIILYTLIYNKKIYIIEFPKNLVGTYKYNYQTKKLYYITNYAEEKEIDDYTFTFYSIFGHDYSATFTFESFCDFILQEGHTNENKIKKVYSAQINNIDIFQKNLDDITQHARFSNNKYNSNRAALDKIHTHEAALIAAEAEALAAEASAAAAAKALQAASNANRKINEVLKLVNNVKKNRDTASKHASSIAAAAAANAMNAYFRANRNAYKAFIKKIGLDGECSICLGNIQKKKNIQNENILYKCCICKGVFHKDCLQEYINNWHQDRIIECPNCRTTPFRVKKFEYNKNKEFSISCKLNGSDSIVISKGDKLS